MSEIIPWLLLLVSVANGVGLLVLFLFIRSTGRRKGDAEKTLREELRIGREESAKAARELREELANSAKSANEALSTTLSNMAKLQQTQLEAVMKQSKELTETSRSSLERIRSTFDTRLKELQEGNEKKLEAMRKTVDEKLHETLEKRLGESFKLVGDRLEAVQRGLGEMRKLAAGVGDLKRVLTNVKVRGTWAEVQLGAILEEILTPTQYEKNVRTKEDSSETVEYAVRLPGPKDDPETCVWLPIDSKFPQEDYLRLQEAAEKGDSEAVARSADALSQTIRSAAKDIHDKYLNPPATTDFAIMFLATEGLYAEALRHPALSGELQQRYRILLAGPTTLAAVLNSLRVGFQTLAIEQRAAEVWRVLGAVKTEFGRFGTVLDKVKRQLNTASRTIDETGVRTRAIARKLRAVEQLPQDDSSTLLRLPDSATEPEEPAEPEEEEVETSTSE